MSIILDRLTKRYEHQIVVDDVSLEIPDGSMFVLVGASGSGKSTILRMIAGLMPVDEGRIYLHGTEVTDLPPQRRNVGLVFQNYSLFRHMTVAQNIEFGLTVRRVPEDVRSAKRNELLELVGLVGLGDRYPRQLSGGQQQRVAVARALAFEPSVLLLDEPFGALDVRIRGQLRGTLKRLQRHLNVTTILVTHDQEEAFELADAMGVIDRGKLLEVGDPGSLYKQPSTETVAQFLGQATLLSGQSEGGQIRLGNLLLPDPDAGRQALPDDDVGVLLRPEDLALVRDPGELAVPLLGQGEVEAVHFVGALTRIHVKLDSIPGVRVLGAGYGEEGVALQIAQMAGTALFVPEVGERAFVGIKSFHVLTRTSFEVLLVLDERADAGYLFGIARALRSVHDLSVSVLVLAEDGKKADQIGTLAKRWLARRGALRVLALVGDLDTEAVIREVSARPYTVVVLDGRDRGTTGRKRAGAMEHVARRSPASVLVVKGDRPRVRRVLLCTAGGEPGKLNILVGSKLARRLGAEVTLLYVLSGERDTSQIPPSLIERHLAQGVNTLRGRAVTAVSKIRTGEPTDEILEEASEGDHDLVLVGAHLDSSALPFREHDLMSDVLHRSDRSVLIVRGDTG